MGAPYEYDIAVSFAGAQRGYVEQFVEACRQRGLSVFYDRDMAVPYWGRNFVYEFRKVYGGSSARFVMPFLSAEYLATPYPQDELAAAVEQGVRRVGQPYLLPVVVGNVAVPPELLNPAIGWLRADEHTPSRLADLTARRLEQAGSEAPPTSPPPARGSTRAPASGSAVARTAVAVGVVVAAAGAVWWVRDYLSGNPSGDWRLIPMALTVIGVCGAAAVLLRGRARALGVLAVAGLGVLTAVTGLVPSRPSCARQTTQAVVRPGPDSGAAEASLTEASYRVEAESRGEVFAEMAGQVRGGPGRDQVLWIIGTADPDTHDSQSPPVRGSPRYHMVRQVRPDDAGCWSMTRKSVGYDCAGGLTFRYYLAVLGAAQAQEMDRLDDPQDGFTEQDIEVVRRIPLLSTFDVPTERNC